MAAKDYIKTAAAELRNATAYLERQLHELAQERDSHTKLRSNEVGHHQMNLKVKEQQLRTNLASGNNNIKQKAALELEIHHLRLEIANKQQEIQTVSTEFSRRLEIKQRHVNDLITKAKELEAKANEPELAD
jgi:hypothetical protein